MTAPHAGRPDTGTEPASATGTDEASIGLDIAASAWPAFLAGGIGCLVVGIVLLAWPRETLVVVAVLIGIAMIVAGLQRLIHGFTAREATGGWRAASVLLGLLGVLVGLYLIRHYHVTVTLMAIVLGLFWVIYGIAEMGSALSGAPGSGRWLTMLSGVLSLAAGLIVLFWPTPSLTVLVVVMGIWLIVYSIFLIVSALRLRHESSGMRVPA
jgi:uncharacterized membrane protein HdeD (DUF308 family)